MGEGYTEGDVALYLGKGGGRKVLYGKAIDDRKEGEEVPLNGIGGAEFSPSGAGAIVLCAVFEDCYGLGFVRFSKPGSMLPVTVKGMVHEGSGEMGGIERLARDRYLVQYNIDGCSWA